MFAHARPMSMNLAMVPDRADDDATQPYHAAGADRMDRRRVIVVVGQGQLVTAIVLRGMGFQVDLAADVDEAARLMHSTHASMLFVRISRSHLRSLRRPGIAQRAREGRTLVAMVDSEDDTPLPGFDATIAIDDIASLTSLVRQAAPTERALPECGDDDDEAEGRVESGVVEIVSPSFLLEGRSPGLRREVS